MARTSIQLINSALNPSVITIPGISVNVRGKKNVEAKPPAINQTAPCVAQTLSWENPEYTITGIHLLSDTTSLQYSHILQLYRQYYTGSNPSTLIVKYGTASTLLNSLGAATGIKVVLEDFSLPISTQDSKDGYMPVATLSFRETG